MSGTPDFQARYTRGQQSGLFNIYPHGSVRKEKGFIFSKILTNN